MHFGPSDAILELFVIAVHCVLFLTIKEGARSNGLGGLRPYLSTERKVIGRWNGPVEPMVDCWIRHRSGWRVMLRSHPLTPVCSLFIVETEPLENKGIGTETTGRYRGSHVQANI